MTRNEAIDAISNATNIFFVLAVITRHDKGDESTPEIRRIPERTALAVMSGIPRGQFEHFIHVSDDRQTVTIGQTRGDAERYGSSRAKIVSQFEKHMANF